MRKNGYETENYAYLLFYHPKEVHENGNVDFHAELIKMKVDITNAERIFKKAIEILKNDEPSSSEECGFCKWITNNKF